MDYSLFISFVTASFLMTILPGPDFLFVFTQSTFKGKKTGIAIALGLSLGIIIHSLLAATGVSLFIQKSELIFNFVKLLGAFYLLYLSFIVARSKPNAEIKTFGGVTVSEPYIKMVSKGFLMNVLNPKVSLFFIAFLPQFIGVLPVNYSLQIIFLGFVFMIQAFVVFSTVALMSSQLGHCFKKPRFWIYCKWIQVVAFLGIGLFLLF
jgi:threonine/homoserine/homoserine lactone efflux protein